MYGNVNQIRQPSTGASAPSQWGPVKTPTTGTPAYTTGKDPGLGRGMPATPSAPRTADPNAQYPSWTYQAQNPTAPYGPGYSTSTPPMAIQPTYPPASSPSVPPGSAVTPGTPSVGNPYQPYTPPSSAPPMATTMAMGEEGGGGMPSIPPGAQPTHPFNGPGPGVRNDGTKMREKGSARDPNAEAWRTQGTPGTANYKAAQARAAENRQDANALRHDQKAMGNRRAAANQPSQPTLPPWIVGPIGGGGGTNFGQMPGGGNLAAILRQLLGG